MNNTLFIVKTHTGDIAINLNHVYKIEPNGGNGSFVMLDVKNKDEVEEVIHDLRDFKELMTLITGITPV